MRAAPTFATEPWPWLDDGQDAATLILLGEINLQERAEPAAAFRHVLPTLRQSDAVFGQLEGLLAPPSTDPLAPDIPHKAAWRHSEPRMMDGLTAAGFAAVSCASNVAYGAGAIVASREMLEAAGIAPCGVGRDEGEAHRPAIVERAGVRFGFLSYTSVFWPVGHAAGPDSPGVATVKIHTSYEPGRRALEMPGAPPTIVTIPNAAELARMAGAISTVSSSAAWCVASAWPPSRWSRPGGTRRTTSNCLTRPPAPAARS